LTVRQDCPINGFNSTRKEVTMSLNERIALTRFAKSAG